MRILALDAGTSSVKAVLAERVDDCWRLIGTGLAPLEAPSSDIRGGAEQDPEAWWAASCAAITQLGVVDCDAVALSGQMQSVLPVGANGRTVVRHALLYCDARAEVEAAEVVARLGKERLHAECSNFKGAVSVLPKMLWLLRHEPDAGNGDVTATFKEASLQWIVPPHVRRATRRAGVASRHCNFHHHYIIQHVLSLINLFHQYL